MYTSPVRQASSSTSPSSSSPSSSSSSSSFTLCSSYLPKYRSTSDWSVEGSGLGETLYLK
jgi:hypothetical protein